MFKDVSGQKLLVFAFDSTTNLPKTGDASNITAYVSKDFGTVTELTDTSATEMDATNAKGFYLFDLAQAETNADTLLFTAKSSTANIVVLGAPATVFTNPPGFTGSVAQTGDSFARLGAPAGASIAADLAEIEVETDGIATVQTTVNTLATEVGSPLQATADFSAAMKTSLATAVGTPQTGDSFGRIGANGVGLTQVSGGFSIAFPNIILTGTVAASPAPTATAVTVILDQQLNDGTLGADFIGLDLTYTNGARLPVAGAIKTATITDTTHVILGFQNNTFAGPPAAGDSFMISQ